MPSLTCRGAPMTSGQTDIARIALKACAQQNAPRIVAIAMIYAAMGESTLGAGSSDVWSNSTSDSPETEAYFWLKGGHGFRQGGGIACAQNNPSYAAWQIANAVEANARWIGAAEGGTGPGGVDSYAQETDPPTIAEASAIVAALYTGSPESGGVYGLGGSGTSANTQAATLWTVGNSSNPDQDYWTTINGYCQSAQWYCWVDPGYGMYVADGIELMAQTPAAVIVRTDPEVLEADLTYDNSAFTFTHTHINRFGRPQRRATLAKTQSPTQCTVKYICRPFDIVAGNTVVLQGFGPADGTWLVGDNTRSMYQIYSELTLVQGTVPINANTGNQLGPTYRTGKGVSKPGSGYVIGAMISEASSINDKQLPYEYGGGQTQAGTPSVGVTYGNHVDGYGTVGFDCAGAVAAVLVAGGLWPEGSSVGGDANIPAQLLKNGSLLPGEGTGRPECTIFDSPGYHIFMRLNGQYWGTSDGGGTPIRNGGSGGAWISYGGDVTSSEGHTFNAYHVPKSVLGQQAASTQGGSDA